ncbi:MAG: PEGA domain-containing protein [Methanomicrobiales archaeon]|nr:PEGA domain-containing protein [Methanomicrobiales archaeon]
MSFKNILLIILLIAITTQSACGNDMRESNSPDALGWFQFESQPMGELIFDGVSYGNTPVKVPVSMYSNPFHEVIIKMEGYEEYSREITENPGPGETIPVSLNTNLIANIQKLLSDETPLQSNF